MSRIYWSKVFLWTEIQMTKNQQQQQQQQNKQIKNKTKKHMFKWKKKWWSQLKGKKISSSHPLNYLD